VRAPTDSPTLAPRRTSPATVQTSSRSRPSAPGFARRLASTRRPWSPVLQLLAISTPLDLFQGGRENPIEIRAGNEPRQEQRPGPRSNSPALHPAPTPPIAAVRPSFAATYDPAELPAGFALATAGDGAPPTPRRPL